MKHGKHNLFVHLGFHTFRDGCGSYKYPYHELQSASAKRAGLLKIAGRQPALPLSPLDLITVALSKLSQPQQLSHLWKQRGCMCVGGGVHVNVCVCECVSPENQDDY